MFRVPVVDKNQNPLMPTTILRARRWIKSGKATGFWKKGIFCVRLNVEPSDNQKQPIALGIDPGSKKEGFTVKSCAHTLLNIQADAVQHVKSRVKTRRIMCRSRRNRNTPCRAPRPNRACLRNKGRIPPSTKARWQFKLNTISWLRKIYPITNVVVEDISAESKKGQRRWNKSFSPLEVGKNWFYNQIPDLIIKQGYETSELRKALGLKKSTYKLSNDWSAHCVDSWVLANSVVGGDIVDNKEVLYITPLQFHRRQLHVLVPAKGGKRRVYGGTISLGLKRGSLVKHPKYGIAYVGGFSNRGLTLCSVKTGKRISFRAKHKNCKFLCYSSIRIH